jgi:hypothetical protein
MRAVILVVFAALSASLGDAGLVQAQAARELTLDVRPWSADVGIAWRIGGAHLAGFTAGGGADDLNRTFVPDVRPTDPAYVTLEQIVRLGPFYRYDQGGRVSVDVGLRAALGGVRGVSGSPGVVTGVHAAVFYGGRRIRVGPRVFVGAARDGSSTETVVHVDWLTARLRLGF